MPEIDTPSVLARSAVEHVLDLGAFARLNCVKTR